MQDKICINILRKTEINQYYSAFTEIFLQNALEIEEFIS